jgi:hypothetical protein
VSIFLKSLEQTLKFRRKAYYSLFNFFYEMPAPSSVRTSLASSL